MKALTRTIRGILPFSIFLLALGTTAAGDLPYEPDDSKEISAYLEGKTWVEQGIRVKIVTARASDPEGIPPVKSWLKKQGLPDLEVTNEKDFSMIELWDDRAIQVVPNTGRPVLSGSLSTRPKAPVGEID